MNITYKNIQAEIRLQETIVQSLEKERKCLEKERKCLEKALSFNIFILMVLEGER